MMTRPAKGSGPAKDVPANAKPDSDETERVDEPQESKDERDEGRVRPQDATRANPAQQADAPSAKQSAASDGDGAAHAASATSRAAQPAAAEPASADAAPVTVRAPEQTDASTAAQPAANAAESFAATMAASVAADAEAAVTAPSGEAGKAQAQAAPSADAAAAPAKTDAQISPGNLVVEELVAAASVAAVTADDAAVMPETSKAPLPVQGQAAAPRDAVHTLLTAAIQDVTPDTVTTGGASGSSEGSTATAPPLAGVQAPPAQAEGAHAAPRVETVQVTTVQHLGHAVIKNVRLMLDNGEQTLTLRLVPDNLGELHLEVKTVQDALHVRLTSANPAVRDALESQLSTLRDALAKSGIDAATLTIATDVGGGQGSPNTAWGNAREEMAGRLLAGAGSSLESPVSNSTASPRAAHDGLLNVCI